MPNENNFNQERIQSQETPKEQVDQGSERAKNKENIRTKHEGRELSSEQKSNIKENLSKLNPFTAENFPWTASILQKGYNFSKGLYKTLNTDLTPAKRQVKERDVQRKQNSQDRVAQSVLDQINQGEASEQQSREDFTPYQGLSEAEKRMYGQGMNVARPAQMRQTEYSRYDQEAYGVAAEERPEIKEEPQVKEPAEIPDIKATDEEMEGFLVESQTAKQKSFESREELRAYLDEEGIEYTDYGAEDVQDGEANQEKKPNPLQRLKDRLDKGREQAEKIKDIGNRIDELSEKALEVRQVEGTTHQFDDISKEFNDLTKQIDYLPSKESKKLKTNLKQLERFLVAAGYKVNGFGVMNPPNYRNIKASDFDTLLTSNERGRMENYTTSRQAKPEKVLNAFEEQEAMNELFDQQMAEQAEKAVFGDNSGLEMNNGSNFDRIKQKVDSIQQPPQDVGQLDVIENFIQENFKPIPSNNVINLKLNPGGNGMMVESNLKNNNLIQDPNILQIKTEFRTQRNAELMQDLINKIAPDVEVTVVETPDGFRVRQVATADGFPTDGVLK